MCYKSSQLLPYVCFSLLHQEAAKDAEFRVKMNEQLSEMQLAVEEQELQKAAAVKQGETAADEIQRQCTSLLEVSHWHWLYFITWV